MTKLQMIAALLTASLAGSAATTAAHAQNADAIAATQVDCSAFRPLDSSRWMVTKTSIVLNGPKDPEGKLPVIAQMIIVPRTIWPNGVDLVDVLNRKCRR